VSETAPRPDRRALLALLLIVPAPSAGVLAGLYADGSLGVALWAFCKVWLFGLPVAWLLLVDRDKPSSSPVRKGGLLVGAASGLIIAAIIFGAWWLLAKDVIDPQVMKDALEPTGLLTPKVYFAAAAYWILVNSVLEEYVYRWFVYSRARRLMGARAAVAVAGVAFVVHHALALAHWFDWWLTALASLGIGIGGVLWSILYERYETIWVPYISHAIVDVAVFALGALILFG
jgi:uncharacterized protein